MEKKKLKKLIREIRVKRKVMESISHIHAVRTYRDKMAVDLIRLAERYGLGFALITGKF